MNNGELFDSNILIDALNGYNRAEALLRQALAPSISVITWMEVLAGVDADDEQEVRAFFRTFEVIALSDDIMDRSIILRRTSRLKLLDAIILATAQTTGRTLYTRNSRDFIEGPGVQVPYKL